MSSDNRIQLNLLDHQSLPPRRWNSLIARLPASHLLQTWEWGQVKSRYGWDPLLLTWQENEEVAAAALVLERKLPVWTPWVRPRVMYVPKGPLLRDWGEQSLRTRVLDDLQELAGARGGIFIKIDPDVRLGRGIPGDSKEREDPLGGEIVSELDDRNWRFSEDQIQYRNTVMIDLSPDEEEILMDMKQKTRYNVRLAGRRGVEVRVADKGDLGLLYQMYAETALRDGFAIRDEGYYRTVWGVFMENLSRGDGEQDTDNRHFPVAEGLIAEVEGAPVAGLLLFYFGDRAWYLYGMSRDVHRKKMPNYLLQWEAIRRAKQTGCRIYDLWGAPETFVESDPMWGVYRFKEGLGGKVVRHIGAWDFPVRPLVYKMYTRVLPEIMKRMRRRGIARTQQELN